MCIRDRLYITADIFIDVRSCVVTSVYTIHNKQYTIYYTMYESTEKYVKYCSLTLTGTADEVWTFCDVWLTGIS